MARTKKRKHSGGDKRDSKKRRVSGSKILKMFKQFAGEEDYIGPEGLLKFCDEIGLDPEDIVLLVISWHLKAEQALYFTQEEFVEGLQKLGIDSIKKFKKKIPAFRKDAVDHLSSIFEYAFTFSIEEQNQHYIDFDTAISYIQLLQKNGTHTNDFCEFLKKQTSYKVINKDQWKMFYEFNNTVSNDLSDYDENEAWPVMIDEFAEYLQEKYKD
eukprot:TRINITY_DN9493_c0_g1_i2.p1 TRINITY_DN9493_c0_g1~~TRINITY_DN9493_c0_g1_i2.p1  ORF type:complete len:213 (+),score=55.51 TRINITY_DN9493_c0_g1_i2:58-696(+)